MSYSTLAGIGPLGTPELIILGILFVVPVAVIVGVVLLVVNLSKKKDTTKAQPPALPPEQG